MNLKLLLTTLGSFALLGLAFGPLERAFPARAAQPALRPRIGVDLCFFAGQYLVAAHREHPLDGLGSRGEAL